MRWQDKLTKKELAHVREWGGKTLAGFKGIRKVHRVIRDRYKRAGLGFTEPCWICRRIAEKLGIEEG